MYNISWGFAQNPFINNTNGSFKKMSILAADHMSRLNAESTDPDIIPMISRLAAPRAAYDDAYGEWVFVKGNYEGETQHFTEMINELSALKIKEWDVKLQAVFLEGSFEYRNILANRRNPFQSGAYEMRIASVLGFIKALAAHPPLSALKTDVELYYNQLLEVRDTQQQKERLVKQAGDTLEQKRLALGKAMYTNLGGLMQKYTETSALIEGYFDLELLRRTGTSNEEPEEEPENNTVGAGQAANVLSDGDFNNASIITLANTGNVPLTFYLASSATEPLLPPSVGITLQPGDNVTHQGFEFGASFQPFLNVVNKDAAYAGRWEITVNDAVA